jgi:hypothetical protein
MYRARRREHCRAQVHRARKSEVELCLRFQQEFAKPPAHIMQHMHTHSASETVANSSVAHRNLMTIPKLSIPICHSGNTAPVAFVDASVEDVNSYLNPEFQTPKPLSATEVTPGALVISRPFVKSSSAAPSPPGCKAPQPRDSPSGFKAPLSRDSPSGFKASHSSSSFQKPCRRDSSLSTTQSQQPLVSRAQESASCKAPLPIVTVPCHPATPVRGSGSTTPPRSDGFTTPERGASFALDEHSALSADDHMAEQELQEVQARPGSASICTPARGSGGASALFVPISPLGRVLQYPPETVKLPATPVPGKDRSLCVPCQCPKPVYPWTIQQYRLKYPYLKYAGSPGNGSVLNQPGFLKYGCYKGRPFESIILQLGVETPLEGETPLEVETDSKAPRKQRVEDHEDLKKFNMKGERQPGGPPSRHAEQTEYRDVQLTSEHHPQYCLQYSNFLPRLHELRPNLCSKSIVHLWRHVCPTVPMNKDSAMNEAIPPVPRLLVHSSLQDSWAIALLVRFTTFRNPRDGIQNGNCLMNLAFQDFVNRSGNHIMKHPNGHAIPFGTTFKGIGLPMECFTNCIFPQLCVVCISSLLCYPHDCSLGSCATTLHRTST